MSRLIATALAFYVTLFAAAPSWAQCPDDKICFDKQTAIEVRDKARAFQLVCAEGWIKGAPPRVQAVCDDSSKISRIWARAKKWKTQAKAADKAQREANLALGSLEECRRARKAVERKLGKARRQKRFWKVAAVGTTGVAVLTAAAIVLDRVGVVDLTPVQFR